MVLHVAFKLPRSDGHQHEQNDEDYTQPPCVSYRMPLLQKDQLTSALLARQQLPSGRKRTGSLLHLVRILIAKKPLHNKAGRLGGDTNAHSWLN